MLEDLHVRAVIHQLLHGLLHGLVELLVALLDGDALLGHAFNVAERLKLAVGLGDRVAGDRRIGVEHVGLTGGHCGGGFGLTLVGHHFGLLVGLAALGDLVGLVLLDGAGLHCDLRAAHVGGVELLRVALLHGPRGAGAVVAHEVDGLQTLFGDGHGGDAQIVLGADGRDDGVEHGGDDLRLQAQRLGDGLGHVHIVADRGLAVFGVEFGRSIGQFHADGQLAVLDGLRGGGQLGQLVILLDGAHIVTNGGVLRLRVAFGVTGIRGAACGDGEHHGRAQRESGKRFEFQRHSGFSFYSLPIH